MTAPAQLPAGPDRLASAVIATLEQAAFVFAAHCASPPAWTGDVLVARLPLDGPRRCELRLAASERFATTLAANLLGVDRASPERAGDALGELLNVAAGIFAVDAFGARAEHRLGVPEVHRAAGTPPGASVSLLDEEGNRVDAVIVWEAAR